MTKKRESILLALSLIILGLVSVWLIYQKYLKPQYSLIEVLPQNYQISFELKQDRFTLPNLQKQKLLKNPAVRQIYEQVQQSLNNELAKLSNEAKNFLSQTEELIVFFNQPGQYGLAARISNKKQAEKLKTIDFADWHKIIIKDQILALATDADLLTEMAAQKLKETSIPYLSLTLNPWLTVRFKSAFLETDYPQSPLTDLQQVLSPLKNLPAQNFFLEIDSDPYTLSLTLTPEQTGQTQAGGQLADYLPLAMNQADAYVGIDNFNELTDQLAVNPNLQQLWASLDSRLWIQNQLSLSNLVKQLQTPIIFSLKGDEWQLLTSADNRNIFEYYLKNYFAQEHPKESLKILPDGTRVIELIADTSKISWQETSVLGWQVFTYPQAKNNGHLGFALKDDKLIVGNQLNDFHFSQPNLSCSFNAKNKPVKKLSLFFQAKPSELSLIFKKPLTGFSKISGLAYVNGQIQICLGL
jgi:hypothetical protein